MNPDDYFENTAPPLYLDSISIKVKEFISKHQSLRIVLVTSGGTTVPLEANTVRFLDNFSAGTRGSASAEYFLEAGYAVIFLHRQFSLEPWTRHVQLSEFFDLINLTHNGLLEIEQVEPMFNIVKKYKNSKSRLLKIDFTTLTDYLFLLKRITQLISVIGSNAMYYLAAAVSDFFIPNDKMAVHKIQSNNSGLCLEFDQVPKMIQPLVKYWAKGGLIISFKLETDLNLLLPKSLSSLKKYGHQLVIGNVLDTRKYQVKFITENSCIDLSVTPQDSNQGLEIESLIVQRLIRIHDQWIKTHIISL